MPTQLLYNLALGPVAQSVEQRIENPCVGGSIPPQATTFLVFLIAPNTLLVQGLFSFCAIFL